MKKFTKHIIVVGSARSGTSWLCELLARPSRYRLLFEPEHEFQTPKGHLLCDRWIENDEQAGAGASYLREVFSNSVDNDWIAQHSNRKWKRHLWSFIPKRYIIKFVRCNLAAKYMNEQFNIPVLHLIRNPYEVIDSQRRVKFPWLYDLSRFQKQEKLVTYVKERFQFDLNSTKALTDLQRSLWCVGVLKMLFRESIEIVCLLVIG